MTKTTKTKDGALMDGPKMTDAVESLAKAMGERTGSDETTCRAAAEAAMRAAGLEE